MAFIAAAVLELGGCFAFWMWLRRGASPLLALVGVINLIAFAVVLTRTNTAFAGRAYAAYGGIYIAASLVWLWGVERQRPQASDLVGAGIAIIGALVIVGFAPRNPSRPPSPAGKALMQPVWIRLGTPPHLPSVMSV